MSMFEAGAIGFRLQMLGIPVFAGDGKAAEKVVKDLGNELNTTTQKAKPAGTAIDDVGQKAKGAKAPLDDTAKSTKNFGEESAKATPKVKATGESVDQLRAKSEAAKRTIGTAMVGIGAAIAAMALATTASYATFDVGMSQVSAATMATVEQQDQLAESAIDAGAASVFSASESADAQTELAKAGVGVNDILGGALAGSLALAAAGQLGVARAAEIAATTLTVFNLRGEEASHVADLLAAGAGKAQGSVDDLALGLEYIGPTFARLNIPLEDTVGTLALLASNGILGEKAGTGLRGVISSLTAPTSLAASTMKTYGINVFDAQGKFTSMQAVAQSLQAGLGGLDEQTRSAALGAIFGAESANAAGVLYASGSKGVAEWTDKVNDQGFAAEQARKMTDNLTGDIERLGGSFDSALIKTGSGANDELREMVQTLTNLIDWYSNLDEGVQDTAFQIGIGTAAVLIFGGALTLGVPKIVEFRTALSTLNTTMKGTAIAGGAIAIGLTAAVMILGALASSSAEAESDAQDLAATLDEQTGAITTNTRAWVADKLQKDNSIKTAKELGLTSKLIVDAYLGEADAVATVEKAIRDASDPHSKFYKEMRAAGGDQFEIRAKADALAKSIGAGATATEEGARRFQELKEAGLETADSNEEVAGSYEGVTEAVDSVITSLADLATEIDAANGKNLDAREAARALEAAYDDFDAALKENGNTLDITTEKGRANQSALDDIAQAAMDSGQAIIDAGGGYEAYRGSLETSRASILDRINDLGVTGQAATDLADEILAIPTEAQFTAVANIQKALEQVEILRQKYASVGGLIMTEAGLEAKESPRFPWLRESDGGVVHYADGGVEHHVAQFARAGTMRVWAEPETGGEAYIPLAPGKRGRSSAILADVASQFGYQLVPAGAQTFANGGVSGGASKATAAGGLTWTGDIIIPGTPDPAANAEAARRAFLYEMYKRS